MLRITVILVGLVLVMIGTAVMTYQGVTFTTEARQVLDVGPIHATTQQTDWTLPLSPLVGGILVIGGVTLVFVSAAVHRHPHKPTAAPSS